MPTCMYCDSKKKVSREHLWGKWAPDILGRPNEKVQKTRPKHYVNEIDATLRLGVKQGIFSNVGAPIAKTTKVMCEDCNNGWGSKIEDGMKNAYIDIFNSTDKNISEQHSSAIFNWMTHKSFLHMRAAPQPVIALTSNALQKSGEQRLIERLKRYWWKPFRTESKVPDNHKVFIARRVVNYVFANPENTICFNLMQLSSGQYVCLLWFGKLQASISNITAINNELTKSGILEVGPSRNGELGIDGMTSYSWEQKILSIIDSHSQYYRRSFHK